MRTGRRSSSAENALKMLVLFSAPVVFFLIPESVIMDSGSQLCLVKLLTGHECWGCGTTRSFWCILHLKFQAAWQFNHLALLTFPLVSCIWLQMMVSVAGKIYRG